MYGCRTTAQTFWLSSVATLMASHSKYFKKLVASGPRLKVKFSLENTDLIRGLAQHTFVAAVLVLYSKNPLSAAVRALISF